VFLFLLGLEGLPKGVNRRERYFRLTQVRVARRVAAKLIDFLFLMSLAVILPYPLGPLVAFLYSLFADGISIGTHQGQSIGKRLIRLQVMNTLHHRPANYRDSVLRNAPVGVATFFAIIPVWGWVILALMGLPLTLMEVYLMLSVEGGRRLGDVMGDTEVIAYRKKA